jgi:hypothetical protein
MFPWVLRLFSLSHSKSKPILTHAPAHPAFYGISIRWPFQLGGRSCRNWDSTGGDCPPSQPEPVLLRGLAARRNHRKSSLSPFLSSRSLGTGHHHRRRSQSPPKQKGPVPLRHLALLVRLSGLTGTTQVDRLKAFSLSLHVVLNECFRYSRAILFHENAG